MKKCEYCLGEPPSKIKIFYTMDNHLPIPYRYKKCNHCELIKQFEPSDLFYNRKINNILTAYYKKVQHEKRNT